LTHLWQRYKQSINKVKLMKGLFCEKQQGSVANAIKSALVNTKVKKKDSIVKKLQRTHSQQNRRSYHLKCQCCKEHDNHFFSLGNFCWLLGTVQGGLKRLCIAAAGTPDQAALAAGIWSSY
jgi:biopolymer transport protein ExbB